MIDELELLRNNVSSVLVLRVPVPTVIIRAACSFFLLLCRLGNLILFGRGGAVCAVVREGWLLSSRLMRMRRPVTPDGKRR